MKEASNYIYNQKPETKKEKFLRKISILKWKEEEKVRREKGKVTIADMEQNKKYQALERVLSIII